MLPFTDDNIRLIDVADVHITDLKTNGHGYMIGVALRCKDRGRCLPKHMSL